MSERHGERVDRRGTWLDWPVAVIVLGVLVVLSGEQVTMLSGVPPLLGWVAIVFGAVSILIRRGAFTPRGR